jgi:hypothetical protein
MTTPDHQSSVQDASRPETKDRIYRSPAGIAGGVLLLIIAGWLGLDALISGTGRTPWLALAGLILVVPLVVAFTLRPAVFVNDDRLRIRNPFRVVVVPWGQVAALRSGYSNELVTKAGTKYQLWSVPVSFRARKRTMREQTRAESGERRGGLLGGAVSARGRVTPQADAIMDELRELLTTREQVETSQGEVTVRWAYELIGLLLAGAVLLTVLLAIG